MKLLEEIAGLVESGKIDAASKYPRNTEGQPGVVEKVQEAIDAGIDPLTILDDGLSVGMRNLGKKFNNGQAFIPEILLAMRALQAGVALLKPLLGTGHDKPKGTILLGTVAGDVHDIGKNLLRMLLESAGWEVEDLGVNVPPQTFVNAAQTRPLTAIGMSALLTTTMGKMSETIIALRNAGVQTPVLIGGAPVTDKFAEEIGAIYGRNPQAAIEILDHIAASSA